MNKIVTIDLEDWHSLVYRRLTGILPPASPNIFRQLDYLLNLLAEHNTKATFFVLGALAENQPDLIKKIAAQGHEIASHGYGHQPIFNLSPELFMDDAKRAKYLLEDIIGKPVRGYRAPEFSVVRETLWALEILAELGFEYDSSIFPIYHRRYGIPGFSPQVKRYRLRNGLKIIEVPLTTFPWGKVTWPVAGGGYFRLMPLWLIYKIMNELNDDNIPVIIYFHPYEFDSRRLDSFYFKKPDNIKEWCKGHRYNLYQNMGRRTISTKLKGLLTTYEFTTCHEYLAKINIMDDKLKH